MYTEAAANTHPCRDCLADGRTDAVQLVAGGSAEEAHGDNGENANQGNEEYVLDEGGALFLADNTGNGGLNGADHNILLVPCQER